MKYLFTVTSLFLFAGMVKPGDCGSTVTLNVGDQSYFTSPNYPDKYPPNSDCERTFKVNLRELIRLEFELYRASADHSTLFAATCRSCIIHSGLLLLLLLEKLFSYSNFSRKGLDRSWLYICRHV